GRPAEHPGRVLRGRPDRRRRPLAPLLADHPAAADADDPLHAHDRHHRQLPDLHPGVRPDRRRAERRQPVLRPLHLPAGVPVLPDGLRRGAGLGAVRDRPDSDPDQPALRPLVGLLRDGQGVSVQGALGVSVAYRRRRTIIRWLKPIVTHTLMLLGSAVMLFPLLWMVSISLGTQSQLFKNPPEWI